MIKHKKDPQLSFESKFSIGVENQCWLWNAAKTPKGYGVFWDTVKLWLAHRYAYTIYKGIIPEKLHVCHSCDNPSCVNPDHLWLGTNLQNRLDSKNKNRVPKSKDHWNYASGVYTKKLLHMPYGKV